MVCSNCGSPLTVTAKFCSACGCSTSPHVTPQTSPVTNLFSEPVQPPTRELPSSPPPPLARYQYQQMNPSTPPTPGYQYQMPVNPYVPPVYAKRKEPGIALLLSLLLPGLGQIYNGDVGKGIAFMIGFFVLIWIGIGIVFWIWGMIDAYQVATNINLGRRL